MLVHVMSSAGKHLNINAQKICYSATTLLRAVEVESGKPWYVVLFHFIFLLIYFISLYETHRC